MPNQPASLITSNVIYFRDLTGQFGPLTDLRNFANCRNGALTNFERIHKSIGNIPLLAHSIIHKDFTTLPPNDLENWLKSFGTENAILFLNERILDWPTFFKWLDSHFIPQIEDEIDAMYAAYTPQSDLLAGWLPGASLQDQQQLWQVFERQAIRIEAPGCLADRPWQIQDRLKENLLFDLNLLQKDASHLFVPEGFYGSAATFLSETGGVHESASPFHLPSQTVLNTKDGPLLIATSSQIHPITSLTGPAYIGPNSHVLSMTQIKALSVLGPTCKVAGEISASIMQGHANKAHAGYLGNAYVGEWANLGADTTVSNLKNNYGEIRVKLASDTEENSNRQFLGPIIGDYVRTAIGTRLTTGAVIGTGSMVACQGLSPKYMPPFSWYTDQGNKQTDFEKFIATARKMMARRQQRLSDRAFHILKSIHEATKS